MLSFYEWRECDLFVFLGSLAFVSYLHIRFHPFLRVVALDTEAKGAGETCDLPAYLVMIVTALNRGNGSASSSPQTETDSICTGFGVKVAREHSSLQLVGFDDAPNIAHCLALLLLLDARDRTQS